MVDKQTKRIVVFSGQQYDGDDWPHPDAQATMGWFQSKLGLIPSEYLDEARIEIDTDHGYEDSCYVSIEIYYYRPETEGEEAERIAEQSQKEYYRKQEELMMLARLKAKYE